MTKFKQKNYTIQEGHYTGSKDLEKIPSSLEVIGKSTIGGSAAGGLIGGVIKTAGVDEASITDGIATGGKAGFVTGIIAKFLLNALHKPMKTVKYQEVDKMIRAKFGIYRVSGFTAGDTFQKRKTVEEKFGFNDRKVTDYKISFCIRDNQVTMYTLRVTDKNMDDLNSSLDYYCKKYSGMEYTARPINTRDNSYSVTIVFTNYKAISDFIFEISERLGYKINLLNDNILLERLGKEESKNFSLTLDKYDKLRILGKMSGRIIKTAISGPKEAWCEIVSKMVTEGFKTLSEQEKAKYFPSRLKNFGVSYLEGRLKHLGFIEGVHYTVGMKSRECNIRLDRGLFMVTSLKGSKSDLLVSGLLPDDKRKEVNNKVNLWTMYLENRVKFDILLGNLIRSGVKPNIFIG